MILFPSSSGPGVKGWGEQTRQPNRVYNYWFPHITLQTTPQKKLKILSQCHSWTHNEGPHSPLKNKRNVLCFTHLVFSSFFLLGKKNCYFLSFPKILLYTKCVYLKTENLQPTMRREPQNVLKFTVLVQLPKSSAFLNHRMSLVGRYP